MQKAIKLSYPVTAIIVALLWLFPVPVDAGIYKWKDDRGKTHFTDDKSKIPLKYRDQFQKFKGVSEPKPEPVEVSEEPGKTEKAGKEKEETAATEPGAGSGEGGGGEAKPEKKKNAKLIAILKEAIKFLEDENRVHQRTIKFVKPDVQNGRHYIADIRRGVAKKEQFIKKLKEFKLPSLKRTRRFLKGTLARDKQEKVGGEGYLERIKNLKQRMEGEIKSKEKIIKKLQSDLDQEEG